MGEFSNDSKQGNGKDCMNATEKRTATFKKYTGYKA